MNEEQEQAELILDTPTSLDTSLDTILTEAPPFSTSDSPTLSSLGSITKVSVFNAASSTLKTDHYMLYFEGSLFSVAYSYGPRFTVTVKYQDFTILRHHQAFDILYEKRLNFLSWFRGFLKLAGCEKDFVDWVMDVGLPYWTEVVQHECLCDETYDTSEWGKTLVAGTY